MTMQEAQTPSSINRFLSPSLEAGLILGIAAVFSMLFIMGAGAESDLVISDLFLADDTCYDGGYRDTPINVTVENRGDDTSNSTDVDFFLMPGNQWVGDEFVGILGMGESREITFPWDSMGYLGDRTIVAVVDHDDTTGESNEENNNASIATGSWTVITGDGTPVEYSDSTIVISGNLDIAGELILHSCSLLINSTPGEEPFGITVEEYDTYKGNLTADDSLIAAADISATPYRFKVQRRCGMLLRSVVISDIYWDRDSGIGGMDLASDDVYILNSTIAAGGICGIRTRANVTISSSIIRDSGYSAYFVVQEGNYAYTSSPHAGITILNVTTPYDVTEAGRFRLPEAVGGYGPMQLTGDMLVVSVGHAGLQVVNISDPENPVLEGKLLFSGREIADISLFGGRYCAVVDTLGYLHTVDISDPGSPQLLDSLKLDPTLEWLDTRWRTGDSLACAANDGTLYLIDIEEPDNLELVSDLTIRNITGDVLFDGDYVYVGAESEILTVNISDPSSPGVLRTVEASGVVSGISMDGSKLVAACGKEGIVIYDKQSEGRLSRSSMYDSPGRSTSTCLNLQQQRVYVADREGGLRLVHVGMFAYEEGYLERTGTSISIIYTAFVTLQDSYLSDHLLFSSRGSTSRMTVYSSLLEGHTAADLEEGGHVFSGCSVNTHSQGIIGREAPIMLLENLNFAGIKGTAISMNGGFLMASQIHVTGPGTGLFIQSSSIEIENFTADLDPTRSYAGKFYDSHVDLIDASIQGAFRGFLFSSGSGEHTLNITGLDLNDTGIGLYLLGGIVTIRDADILESGHGIEAEDCDIICNEVRIRGNDIALKAVDSDLSLSYLQIGNTTRGLDLEKVSLNLAINVTLNSTGGIRAGNSTILLVNSSLHGDEAAHFLGDTESTFIDVIYGGEMLVEDDASLLIFYTLDLHVIDKRHQDFPNVDISIRDTDGSRVFTGKTNATGMRNGIILFSAEYDRDGKTLFTPHTLNLSYSDQHDELLIDMNASLEKEHIFVISEKPVAVLSPTKLYTTTRDEIKFKGNGSFDPDGEVMEYYFDFGDGNDQLTQKDSAYHEYAAGGVYIARLIVWDDEEEEPLESDPVSIVITINDPPIATIQGVSTIKVTTEEPFYLNGSASRDDNEEDPSGDQIVRYEWDMKNGDIFTTPEINYTYYEKGEYGVRLRVWDSFGEKDEVGVTVKVSQNSAPFAYIGVGDTNNTYRPEGHFISFDGSESVDPDDKALHYLWDFGDGVTLEGDEDIAGEADHRFYDADAYNVTLTVTDMGGLSHTNNVTVNIIKIAGNLSTNNTIIDTDDRRTYLEFKVTNTGSHRERFSVRFFKPSSWSMSTSNLDRIYLNASESKWFNRSINLPSSLVAGDYDFTTELYSHRDDEEELVESMMTTIRMLSDYQTSVSVRTSTKEGKRGKEVEFTITAGNKGNAPDRLVLSVEDLPQGWSATYDGESLPYTIPEDVEPKDNLDLPLVIVPSDDAVEDMYQITVRITSFNDEDVTSTRVIKVLIPEDGGGGGGTGSDEGLTPTRMLGIVVIALIVLAFLKARGGGTEAEERARSGASAAARRTTTSGEAKQKAEKIKVPLKKGEKDIPCPRCDTGIPVTSKERPLRIECPKCGATGTIK